MRIVLRFAYYAIANDRMVEQSNKMHDQALVVWWWKWEFYFVNSAFIAPHALLNWNTALRTAELNINSERAPGIAAAAAEWVSKTVGMHKKLSQFRAETKESRLRHSLVCCIPARADGFNDPRAFLKDILLSIMPRERIILHINLTG